MGYNQHVTEQHAMTRTINLKLDMPLELAQRTIQEWLDVCNYISQVAFESGCVSNNVRLHHMTYNAIRARFSLSSQMSCNAIRHVASKYAALRTQKVTPEQPIVFRKFSLTMQHKYDFSYLQTGLSLYTIEGRHKGVQFKIGAYADQYVDWDLGGATLYIRRGSVYLAQTVSKAAPDPKAQGTVIGVDKGINYLATATDGARQRFFGGGKVKHRKRHYQKTRASLQKKKAENAANGQSTRSVRRVLKRLSGRERRYMRNTNHVVSKCIVQFATEQEATVIATENLEGIRERANECGKILRKLVNGWSFYQLQAFLSYKAEAAGMVVDVVDPRNTSRACSHCGYCDQANRRKHDFHCQSCGYQLHADLNAARNIQQRSIVVRQALCDDGAQVNRPLSTEPANSRLSGSGASHPLKRVVIDSGSF
jgi:putative transposase